MKAEKTKVNAVVTANWAGSVLTLAVAGAGAVVFDMDAAGAVLVERAAMHGFEQRLRDRAAMSRDTKTGLSASPQDKFDRIKALADHYAAGGEWEMRSGGGGKKSDVDWIIEALAAIKGVDVETMRGRVIAAAEKRGITAEKYAKQVGTGADVAAKVAALKYGESDEADEMTDELDGEEG